MQLAFLAVAFEDLKRKKEIFFPTNKLTCYLSALVNSTSLKVLEVRGIREESAGAKQTDKVKRQKGGHKKSDDNSANLLAELA